MSEHLVMPPNCKWYFQKIQGETFGFVWRMYPHEGIPEVIPLDQLTLYQRGLAAAVGEIAWTRVFDRAHMGGSLDDEFAAAQHANAYRMWGEQK